MHHWCSIHRWKDERCDFIQSGVQVLYSTFGSISYSMPIRPSQCHMLSQQSLVKKKSVVLNVQELEKNSAEGLKEHLEPLYEHRINIFAWCCTCRQPGSRWLLDWSWFRREQSHQRWTDILTPLHDAAREVARLLIEAGSDVNKSARIGSRPSHIAFNL